MKKRLAVLLSLIFVLNFLPAQFLHAAGISGVEFKEVIDNRLEIDDKGILTSMPINQQNQPLEGEVNLQWNIPVVGGKFDLVYYTDAANVNKVTTSGTTKITATFEVDFDENNTRQITYSINAEKRFYESREPEFPVYEQYESERKTIKASSIEQDRGITFNGINGVIIKMFFDFNNNIIHYSTTGISGGNFTEFDLVYNDNSHAYVSVLKNAGDSSITPTHYEHDMESLKDSKDEIRFNPNDTELQELAGTRPGIKVQFKLPKRVNKQTGLFEMIDEFGLYATLALEPNYEEGSLNRATIQIPLFTADDVSDSQGSKRRVKLFGSLERDNSEDKYAEINDNTVTLYLCKYDDIDNKELKTYIIKWKDLEESMFIGGTVRIDGLETIDNYEKPKSKAFELPEGVTYLKYNLVKTETDDEGDDNIVLEITPYKYEKLNYWIYKRDAEGEMPEDYPPYRIYPYQYSKENKDKTLIINVKDKGSSTFQIKPTKTEQSTDLYASQRLIIDSSDMLTAPPGATVKEVSNLYVIETIGNDGPIDSQVGAAGFDMRWTTPSVTALERYLARSSTKDTSELGLGHRCDAKLYYEVRISDKKEDQNGEILCIIEMSLDEKGKLVINKVATEGNETSSKAYVGNIETILVKPPMYGVESTELWLKNVVLKDYASPTADQYIYQDKNDNNEPKNYLNQTNYPWNSKENAKNDLNPNNYFDRGNSSYTYEIPSKYYLRIRTVLDPGIEGERLQTNVLTQEPYELTLDRVKKEIPVPKNVTIGDKSLNESKGADLSIQFDNLNLDDYIYYEIDSRKYELKPNDSKQDPKEAPRTYEIYFYQDSYIDNNKITQKRELTDTDIENLTEKDIYEINFTSEKKEILTIDINHLEDPYAHKDEGILEALRNGKIIKISYETTADTTRQNGAVVSSPIKILFKGLDTNQSYNVRARTTIKVYDTLKSSILIENPPATDTVSKLSKVIGSTTDTGTQPPTDDENRPPTPENFTAQVDEVDSSHRSILNWDDPEFAYKEELTYDIVRVESEPLSEELLKQGMNLSLEAFKTLINRNDLKDVHYTDKKITKQDENGNTYLVHEYSKDTDLKPNTIYYYYLRSNYNNKYSQWLVKSITTSNIDRPINLIPITSTINSIDVSFEAKAPMGQVPSNYDFEIMIQEDGSSEWVKANITKLEENQTNVTEGYTYFKYRINSLKPNLRYNIKVRMIDKTKGEPQMSLYSDVKYIRTMYDQDTQDKEDKFDAYLKKFDMEMEKLKKRPYWTVEDGTYKYRETYMVPELNSTKNFTLISETNATEGYYYIPADAITAANNNQVILEAKLGDLSISIRPDTLTTDNETIQEAIQRMNTKYIGDYYIGLRVSQSPYTNQINGQDPVSPKLTVELEVIQSKLEEWELEENIMTELVDQIAKERLKFIDKLRSRVDREHISEEDLQTLIDDSVADIEADHQNQTSKAIDKAVSRTESITQLSKAISITISNLEDALVTGYYQNGNLWTEVTSYPTGDGIIIEAILLGSYIAAGQASLIDTIPGLAPYQSFISKYGLGSIFTLENETNVKEPVTKKQVYASTARVLGAAKDSDYATFLKNKGINGVALLTQDNDGRQDEIIYMVMQAYEVLKNKKVSQVRITNKQAVTNIGAFQPVYRDYVYAAVELKIIDNPDNRVLPSSKITQEDYIKILYKMTQR